MRDRISALPDEIVSIILSLLTIKEAGSTSVLSQRWINSWKLFAGSLNFDGSKTMGRMIKERATMSLETERTKYVKWVDEVLNFYQGQNIKEFRVCFDLQKDFACIIDGWINFAIERRVQRLELDLTTYRGNRQGFDYYTFPSSPLGVSSLNTLTVLRLKSVDLREDILNQLLSDCPLIEELCVSYSPSLVNVRIAGPSKLKYLEVSFCFNLVNVEISATNLVSFKYFGSKLCHPLKNVPMLSNVYIGGCYCESVVWTSFDDLSKVLSQLETLVLDISSTAERSYLIPVTFPEFCNLRQLELTVTAYADQCILFLSRFLNASPCLYKLVVKIRFVQASESNMQEPDIVQIVPFEGKPRLSIRGRHECLKVVEIVGWVGTVADSELAIYLLEKAVSLDKIILDPRYPSILVRSVFQESMEDEHNAARERAKQLKSKLPVGTKLVIH